MNANHLLGFHIGGGVYDIIEETNWYIKNKQIFWYQMFLTNPRMSKLPDDVKIKTLNKEGSPEANFIVHSPYLVNLLDTESKMFNWTVKYTKSMSDVCDRYGIKYYVTHLGACKDANSEIIGLMTLIDFCKDFVHSTKGQKTILCLECDAGASTGRKIGSIDNLIEVINKVGDDRVKMCYDTEHAYANGFDVTDRELNKKVLDFTVVVHLNSIPEEVVKGNHLDRHSKTLLADCKEGTGFIEDLVKICTNKSIPMILERDSKSIILGDIDFVNNVN